MLRLLPSLFFLLLLSQGCTKHSPTPSPQLLGTWIQDHYTFDQPGKFYGREQGSVPNAPNSYMVVGAHAIEYHLPDLSGGPVTQSYTRQGNNLHIAAGTLNDRVETITSLTDQELVLHITRVILPSFSSLKQDSVVLDYFYKRQ